MTFEQQIAKIGQLSEDAAQKIDSLLASSERRVSALQKEFIKLFIEEIVLKFKETDGVVIMDPSNMQVIAQIDEFFDRFRRLFLNADMAEFAKGLLEAANLSREYFEGTGFAPSKLDQITAAVDDINNAIGVSDGVLIKGGYLDRLAKADVLKGQLADMVITAINSQMSLNEFTKALRKRVVGNPDADGMLQSYYRQYAYDSFNKVHEVANRAFANGLGLKHFIYTGSLIATSRAFCEKRAGKAYSVEETKKWKDDPDLIDKKTKESYNPLIERGRYNCRHFIKYISEELFYHMRPDLKKP